MIKLLRTHVMAEDGGLLIPNGRGGFSLLGRGSFQELLALDSGELRLCPKLTDQCIQVTIQYPCLYVSQIMSTYLFNDRLTMINCICALI